MRRLLALIVPAAILAGACGPDQPPGADNAAAPQPTGTTAASTATSPPGERQEIYPYQGAELAVAGVAAGDTLKVRSGPGTDFEVVFELRPTATGVATGHNRSVADGGVWSEITVDGRTGWANSRYLLQPGEVNDITAVLYPTPASRPRADTLPDLGRMVARERDGDDNAPIVIVDGPTEGDVGEVTVDLVESGDDSVGGERLKVFAERDRGGYRLRSVEATTFCRRGVTAERLCV
jgi:hypothetical protein